MFVQQIGHFCPFLWGLTDYVWNIISVTRKVHATKVRRAIRHYSACTHHFQRPLESCDQFITTDGASPDDGIQAQRSDNENSCSNDTLRPRHSWCVMVLCSGDENFSSPAAKHMGSTFGALYRVTVLHSIIEYCDVNWRLFFELFPVVSAARLISVRLV